MSEYPGNDSVGCIIVDEGDAMVSAGGPVLATICGHTLYLWGTPPKINANAFTRIVVSSSMPTLLIITDTPIDEVSLGS